MIKRIKLLRNIGAFLSDSSARDIVLKRLVLVHAENGRGKTTLASILRSLAIDNSDLILERRRLGSAYPPHIVLRHEDFGSDVQFNDGAWTDQISNMKIFDDTFVDQNVYSGLDVDSQHRQNMHQIILGEQGVAHNQQHQELVNRIEEHNRELRIKSNNIPVASRHGLDVDKFCALPQIPEIDAKIAGVERTLAAAKRQDEVNALPIFKNLELAEIDVTTVEEILTSDLAKLDQAAEARVQSHISSLGKRGESWLAEGMEHVEESGDACPFCGQDLKLSDLMSHYRAYFGEEYRELKQSIAREISAIERDHATGQQTAFERSVRVIGQTRESWFPFIRMDAITIDTEKITNSWQSAAQVLTYALNEKQSSPLDKRELADEARRKLEVHERHRNEVSDINNKTAAWNDGIGKFREELEAVDLTQIETELNRLRATKERHSAEIAEFCADYLAEQQSKSRTENLRDQARRALTVYRNNIFPTLQEGINEYLARFNAGYRIGELRSRDSRSGAVCTYSLMINDLPVEVSRNIVETGQPSFRNTLSAGDRNTLALALFFSTLKNSPNLGDAVVVLDDPKSSLDDHRSLRTAQEIRRLMYQARQVIVLSHDKRFLCDIWQSADRSETEPLEIIRSNDQSSLVPWDVSADAFTEHDRRHRAFRSYLDNGADNERDIARDLRHHLEGYFRVLCPDEFPPGTVLGNQFVQECQDRVDDSSQIIDSTKLSDLRDILQYAHRFHHDTNPAWQSAVINSTELEGYVSDVLEFVKP